MATEAVAPLRVPADMATSRAALLQWLAAFVFIALYFWLGVRVAWNPPLRTDFPNYYLAARVMREGAPADRMYDWLWLARQKQRAGIDQPLVGYAPLTPFSAIAVAPLAKLPPQSAKRVWLLMNLLLLAATLWFLRDITRLPLRQVLLIFFAAAFPLRVNALLGQEYLLLAALLALGFWSWQRHRPLTSGLLLGIAAAVKIFPIVFVVYFLTRRSWRALAGIAIGFLSSLGVSIALAGWQANRMYFATVLPVATRGETHDPYNLTWNTVTALLHRLLIFEPDLNPHPVVHLPLLYAILQPIAIAVLFVTIGFLISRPVSSVEAEWLHLGTFLVAILAIATTSASYHLVLLSVAAVLSAPWLLRYAPRWLLWLCALAYISISLPMPSYAPHAIGWASILAMPRLASLLAMWLGCVIATVFAARSEGPFRFDVAARFCCVLLVVMVVSGTVANLRAQRNRFGDYSRRLPSPLGTYMRMAPLPTPAGLLSIVMLPDGYGVAFAPTGGASTVLPLGGSIVSAAYGDGYLFAERLADVPEIVRSSLAAPQSAKVIVRDAEQPVLSADRNAIFFLRTSHGRSRLWRKDFAQNSERQITPDALDVVDFTVSNSFAVLAARSRDTYPELYALDLNDSSSDPRLLLSGPARWPSISRDGRKVAFARLNGQYWQLAAVTLSDPTRVSLIAPAACNQVTPAWIDPGTIVYSTDCGRGYLLGTLATVAISR